MTLGTCPLWLKKQQAILEKVQEQQSRMPKMPVPSTTHIEELQREAFNILPGTVNAKRGAALAHASGISQDILVVGRSHFENELTEKAIWASHSHSVMYNLLLTLRGWLTSTPKKYPKEHRPIARFNPATYPPGYEMIMAVQEFHNLHEPKINKLEGGYSATANLRGHSTGQIFHCRAHDGVEFYMGMIVDDHQTFEGLVNHLKMYFSQGRLLAS